MFLDLSLAWPLSPVYAFNFILVLARVGALLGTAPVIGGRSVPMRAKAGLAGLTALTLLVANADRLAPLPETWATFAGLIIQHLLVGLVLGFAAGLTFAALQMAGELIGLQMGFSLARTIDPVAQQQVAVIDQLYTVVAGLVFLAVDGHHWLMLALMRTFDIAPLAGTLSVTGSANGLIALTASALMLALQVALPGLAAFIAADVALGMLVRVAPQMNIFAVGLPLKVALGLLVLAITLGGPSLAVKESLDGFLLGAEGLWR